MPSHAAYAEACANAGGRLIPLAAEIKCSQDGVTLEIILNDEECVPAACSDEEHTTALEAMEQEVADALQEAIGSGSTCSVNYESSASHFGLSLFSGMAALLALAFL